MLEILSGKRNNSFYHADHALNLVGYVCNIYIDLNHIHLHGCLFPTF